MATCKQVALDIVFSKNKSVIPVGAEKRPLVAWLAFQDSVPTRAEVNLWFQRHPDANIGMPTGKFNNLVVIDCDSEHANNIFIRAYPQAISTTCVKTPRGYHYYFKYEEGIRNGKIANGIDIRGEGGYVIIPPSTGYTYLADVEPADMSLKLLDLLVGKQKLLTDLAEKDPEKTSIPKNEFSWPVTSFSDETVEYTVMLKNNKWSCTCPHNVHRKVTCKHIEKVIKER